jgi:hypothetical protein
MNVVIEEGARANFSCQRERKREREREGGGGRYKAFLFTPSVYQPKATRVRKRKKREEGRERRQEREDVCVDELHHETGRGGKREMCAWRSGTSLTLAFLPSLSCVWLGVRREVNYHLSNQNKEEKSIQ